MRFNVHAGHNPEGKIACGAVALLNESREDRAVKNLVISKMRALGHTVYDCTVDNGKNQNDVLTKIVKKCNAHNVDLDISIHFNSGRKDYVGDGSTGGVEVLVYPKGGANDVAQKICNEIAKLGFRNRGVKENSSLYFLKKTNAKALLIECCFVDDADDANIYNADKMANAIVAAICGNTKKWVYEGVDYTPVFNPTYYRKKYADLAAAFGYNEHALFNHFCTWGMKEGRQASKEFNVSKYKKSYKDLRNAFGNDLKQYYRHYCVFGIKEGRKKCK